MMCIVCSCSCSFTCLTVIRELGQGRHQISGSAQLSWFAQSWHPEAESSAWYAAARAWRQEPRRKCFGVLLVNRPAHRSPATEIILAPIFFQHFPPATAFLGTCKITTPKLSASPTEEHHSRKKVVSPVAQLSNIWPLWGLSNMSSLQVCFKLCSTKKLLWLMHWSQKNVWLSEAIIIFLQTHVCSACPNDTLSTDYVRTSLLYLINALITLCKWYCNTVTVAVCLC